ncbi:MAG: tRNA (adenosine(37)-N6)-dimethylallyltransferase MiaA [Methyloligellaceae bacterium]
MSRPDAILIAGPTASGKSAAALAAATMFDGVIINADSMQVYQDLRILTARPSEDDERRAPHVMYGFVDGAQAYSVGLWLEDAAREIGRAREAGRMPIITGGTGLYFRALLEGLSPVPDIPEEIRAFWRAEGERRTAPELHAILAARDPVMAERLRPSDRQRIIRALEVLETSGTSLAVWQQQPGRPVLAPERVARYFIARERAALYQRIDRRFDAMIAAGALEEVRALAARSLSPQLPVMRAVGVQSLLAHLRGASSLEEAVERAKTDSRRYAKRQLTWANRNMIAWKRVILKDSERELCDIFSNIDV